MRLAVLSATGLAALLAMTATCAQDAERAVTGAATVLARIALPESAELVLEARGPHDVLVAEAVLPAAGAQVPLPFALSLPEGVTLRLQAGLRIDGGLRWLSAPVPVAGAGDIDLGELLLAPFRPLAFVSRWDCGGTAVDIGMDGDAMVMRVAGTDWRLVPAEAASGAKYEAEGDPATVFWTKADSALVTLAGAALPECRPAAGPVWRATGIEPDWAITLTGSDWSLARPGAEPVTGRFAPPVWRDGAAVWEGEGATLSARAAICRNPATGLPHPESVTLTLGEEVLAGCGGDPMALIEGAEWVVEDVGGAGIPDGARVTMAFADGRIAGRGGCNRYGGAAILTGEGLSLGPIAATRMACPEALMALEARFFRALAEVAVFDIDRTGALLLRDGAGAVLIRARR